MAPEFTTFDLGIAIRDHLEDHEITHFATDSEGDLYDQAGSHVRFVDVSDAHNPKVHLESGEVFKLTITRVDG